MSAAQPVKQAADIRRERASRSREKARHALLEASAELVLKGGVERFSLRQAAELAGQSPGNVYNYFKDKEDLLRALAQEAVARFNQAQARAVEGISDPLERYLVLGRAYVSFGVEHRDWYQLLQRSDLLMGRVDPHGEPGEESSFRLLTGALQEAMDQGLVRPAPLMPMAAFSWAMVHGIVDLCHGPFGRDPSLLPQLLETMEVTLLRGLLASSEGPSPSLTSPPTRKTNP